MLTIRNIRIILRVRLIRKIRTESEVKQKLRDQIPKINLAAVRANVNKTQKEWAELLGVSHYTVNNWELGKSYPNAIQLRKMSELSGIPMDFIFVPERHENSVSE